MCNASLTVDQVNALAIALGENAQIQEVNLSDNSLTDVEPELLVRALAKTRKLNLANTSLTAEQVKRLLKSFLSDDCTMENLDLSANVLSMIEPDLMAKSLNKLKVVTLLDSDISVNQVGKKYNILLLILIFIQVSTIFKKALADTSLTSFWT